MSLFIRRGAFAVVLVASLTACVAPPSLSFGEAEQSTPRELSFGDDRTTVDNTLGDNTSPTIAVPAEPASATPTEPATAAGVESAFSRLINGWTNCFHRPTRCDVAGLTAIDSPERQRLTESLAFYTTEKMRTKPDEGRLQWAIESLVLTTPDRARLVTCEYDTRIFFDSSMADTEIGDIIFDTTIWTRRVEWTLARVDESWSLWSRRIDRRSPVARFCTP
jgi:hypothetical protein